MNETIRQLLVREIGPERGEVYLQDFLHKFEAGNVSAMLFDIGKKICYHGCERKMIPTYNSGGK